MCRRETEREGRETEVRLKRGFFFSSFFVFFSSFLIFTLAPQF